MRQMMLLMCGALALCAHSLTSPALTAEPETVDSLTDARLLLARRELTRDAKGVFILAMETKLEKHLDWVGDMQKGIPTAVGSLSNLERNYRVLQKNTAQLDQQFNVLSAQYLNAQGAQKNQVSAMLKEVTTKRSEARKQLAGMPAQLVTHEAAVGAARKSLIDGILQGLKQVTEVEAAYAKLKKDPLVDKSLKMISKAEKEVTLGPSAGFQSYGEKLKKMDDQLLVREEFPLEEDGKTLVAEIDINGKKTKFQVHPQTRATQLSESVAKQLGVVVPPTAPKVNFQVSKDEKLSVPEVEIESMKLATLKTSVRAVVLPDSKLSTLPTVGANFFAGRVFQIDAKNKKLKITRLAKES